MVNRPFHSFFQLLILASQEKYIDTAGKSTLKLVKWPNFRFISCKIAKIQLRKVTKFYRRLYAGGTNLPPQHTNVCKISQLYRAMFSLFCKISLSNLANLLISRCSFQQCQQIFANWTISKVEKPWKGLFSIMAKLPNTGSHLKLSTKLFAQQPS